jgi:maltose O-acetyltransferase
VSFGRHVRVDFVPGTTNRLVVGPGSRLQDNVLLWLRGGTIEIGADTALRSGCRLNSSGLLRVGDHVTLSWGTVIHCAELVTIGNYGGTSEYVTVTDSVHVRTVADVNVRDHVTSKPTHLGDNVWIGAQTVIGMGVTVGDMAFVTAGAVVTRDLPGGWLAAGSPARPVRELDVDDTAHPTDR